MRKRLMEIDFVRVLSMFAVILIHVTSTFVYGESNLSLFGMNPAFFINQITRFGVPLFVLLSGFSLGIGQKEEAYFTFVRKRCLRVLPPYMVWTLIYELSNCGYDLRALLSKFQEPYWAVREFLMGRAAPHLYFVVIILQFYFLYPLLRKWMDRAPVCCLALSFTSTLLLQGLYYLQALGLFPAAAVSPFWLTFPFWIFYFAAGMYLQKISPEKLNGACRKHGIVLVLATVLFACLYSLSAARTGFLDSINPALMIYTVLAFLSGIAVWNFLKGLPFLKPVVAFLSAHSMGIYYNHVLILCFFRSFPRLLNGLSGMLLLFLATTFTSILVAFLLKQLQKLTGTIRNKRSAA